MSAETTAGAMPSAPAPIWRPAGERRPGVDMVQNAIYIRHHALAPLHLPGMREYPVGA